MGNACNSKSAPKAGANKPPMMETAGSTTNETVAPVEAVATVGKELPLIDMMTYIRTENLEMLNKTIDSYAPRGANVNFVRGHDEDFEAADPPQSMSDWSLVEVALAYKRNAMVKDLMEVRQYPVLNRIACQINESTATLHISDG
jgi:hypothetical protein